ncbi:MAG TPA: Rrf2 family transcriptional regulator [Actinobacteria bacterium]|nr:Rrf2 family transcriptional regulator [Actinomycetota bacterium]
MRLELTKRTELAMRAMRCLDGELTPGRDLARRLGVSLHYLPQIMGPLVAAGWVDSVPGRRGGYRRIVPLGSVTTLAVIEAVEGPTDTGRCVLRDGPCPEEGQCALHLPWTRARTALTAELGRTSLEEALAPCVYEEEATT